MRFNPTFSSTIDTDIQNTEQALQTALQQVSTGKRVNLPSDDPAASAALVQNLTESATDDQYTANANSALTQTQTADAVLSNVTTLLNSAVTLGTSGANGTLNDTERQAIASQVQSVLSSVVAAANTAVGGVALFGGTASGSVAFEANASGGYTYNGNSSVNYVSVGDNVKVQTNVPGDQIFQQSGASVLGSLQQLATALASGTSAEIGTATDAVTTALNYVAEQHTIYGNSVDQLNSQETYLAQEQVTLTSQQNSLVGIDEATAAENLAQAETQNSATLEAAAKVLPTTLLDYLK